MGSKREATTLPGGFECPNPDPNTNPNPNPPRWVRMPLCRGTEQVDVWEHHLELRLVLWNALALRKAHVAAVLGLCVRVMC